MEILSVTSPQFSKYGRVIDRDCAELLHVMEETPAPDAVVYVPSDEKLEALSLAGYIQNELFGGLPIQIGYCNGTNHTLNAVEYHRSSEVNLACTDLILILGMEQDIDRGDYTYDTGKLEAFLVPAGTLLEVYATGLHYAPCGVNGNKFRCVVVLPKGTNLPLSFEPEKTGESRILFAANKWLIAHPESGLDKDGAHTGLKGENLTV